MKIETAEKIKKLVDSIEKTKTLREDVVYMNVSNILLREDDFNDISISDAKEIEIMTEALLLHKEEELEKMMRELEDTF